MKNKILIGLFLVGATAGIEATSGACDGFFSSLRAFMPIRSKKVLAANEYVVTNSPAGLPGNEVACYVGNINGQHILLRAENDNRLEVELKPHEYLEFNGQSENGQYIIPIKGSGHRYTKSLWLYPYIITMPQPVIYMALGALALWLSQRLARA